MQPPAVFVSTLPACEPCAHGKFDLGSTYNINSFDVYLWAGHYSKMVVVMSREREGGARGRGSALHQRKCLWTGYFWLSIPSMCEQESTSAGVILYQTLPLLPNFCWNQTLLRREVYTSFYSIHHLAGNSLPIGELSSALITWQLIFNPWFFWDRSCFSQLFYLQHLFEHWWSNSKIIQIRRTSNAIEISEMVWLRYMH